MNDLTVEPYSPSAWVRLSALLHDWRFKPLAGHNHWPSGALAGLAMARAARTLERAQTAAWIAACGDGVTGLVSVGALPWDTAQLGMSAARLGYLMATGTSAEQRKIKQVLLSHALAHCADRGIAHLSVRVNASDLSSLHVLEAAGFVTLDGLLTFAFDLADGLPTAEDAGVQIRLASADDGQPAAQLARQAYIDDRFHSDPAIPAERADELYAEWLRSSCAGRAADAVIVAEDDRGLAGYATCRLQRDTLEHLGTLVGTIVLVATAERARRQGVAQATTLAALRWFRQSGARLVEVGTQLRNIPATRLYQNCGFRLVDSSTSLRRLIKVGYHPANQESKQLPALRAAFHRGGTDRRSH